MTLNIFPVCKDANKFRTNQILFSNGAFQPIAAVAVAATGFQIAELGELTQVALGGGGGEAEMLHNDLSGELALVDGTGNWHPSHSFSFIIN